MFLMKYSKDHRDTNFVISGNNNEVASKMHNTEIMYKPWKERLHTYSFVRAANLFKFEDTQALSLTVIYKTLGSVRGDKIFVKSLDKYHLRLESSGKLTITKNKRLAYTTRVLREALSIFIEAAKDEPEDTLYEFLLDAFKVRGYCYDESLPAEPMLNEYRISRNTKLSDLPWKGDKLHKLYISPTEEMIPARASMNYFLRKGNSKKATQACFYGYDFPKSIHKLLVELGPFSLPPSVYKALSISVENSGVDKVRQLLKGTIESGSQHLLNDSILKLLDRGFNISQVNYRVFDLCNDIERMEEAPGIDISKVLPTKNIVTYHDSLIGCMEELRKKGDPKTKLFEANSIHKPELEWTTGDLEFKSPEFATELYAIGKSLHNCVGSYSSKVYIGAIDIVVLKNTYTDKNLLCIELLGNHIVQAKLNHNRSVLQDPEILKVLQAWAKEKDLVLNCYDAVENYSSSAIPVPEVELNLDRLKEISEADKVLRGTSVRRLPRPVNPIRYQRYQNNQDEIPF